MYGTFLTSPAHGPQTTPQRQSEALDWDDLRFFLAVLRSKSLTTAAQQLGVTQSTVGRRLAALEAKLGARLLQRGAGGYTATDAGEHIRQRVERMEAEARLVERAVGGADLRLAGTVRIACPMLLAQTLLASAGDALHSHYPDLSLEFRSHSRAGTLPHDVDIEVRWHRFEQPDLVVRRLGSVPLRLHASDTYLRRYGQPDCDNGCAGHVLIAPCQELAIPGESEWLSQYAGRARVAFRTDCRDTQLWAIAQGRGIGLLPWLRIDPAAGLSQIRTTAPEPIAEIWLGVHAETRHVPRIRMVLDHMADRIQSAIRRCRKDCR